jgi:predicted transcriptional regulator
MNIQRQTFGSASRSAEENWNYLPPQVSELAWRERQIASIVYRRGFATAKQVQFELGEPISNGAVRSMLVRLVAKGILSRRPGKRGAGCSDLFIARLSEEDARKRALAKVADDFFGGSLTLLGACATEMTRQGSPPH